MTLSWIVILFLFGCVSVISFVSCEMSSLFGSPVIARSASDSSVQYCFIYQDFPYNGRLTGIKFHAKVSGSLRFITVRPSNTDWKIVGVTALYNVPTGNAIHTIDLSPSEQWNIQTNDRLGWCDVGSGVVSWDNGGPNVFVSTTPVSSPTVDTIMSLGAPLTRTYSVQFITQVPMIGWDDSARTASDSQASTCYLDRKNIVPYRVKITSIRVYIYTVPSGAPVLRISTFRSTGVTNQYQTIGQYDYPITSTGVQTINIPTPSQWESEAGDFIGWCDTLAGTVGFDSSGGDIRFTSVIDPSNMVPTQLNDFTGSVARKYSIVFHYQSIDEFISESIIDRGNMDGARTCIIDMKSTLPASTIKSFVFWAGRAADGLKLVTWRSTTGNNYQLINYYNIPATSIQVGLNIISIPIGSQWNTLVGDRIGWCDNQASNAGIIKFDNTNLGQMNQLVISSPTIGTSYDFGAGINLQTRVYSFLVAYQNTASIVGDPQFTGFQQQQFQVHGIPNEYFALISTPTYHINARFIYLSDGNCRYNHTTCYSHRGTYIDEITIIHGNNHHIHIIAGTYEQGLKIYINDEQEIIPSTKSHSLHDHNDTSTGSRNDIFNNSTDESSTDDCEYHFISSLYFHIRCSTIDMTIINADHFMNIQVSLHDAHLLSLGSKLKYMNQYDDDDAYDTIKPYSYPLHGLIGQTWQNIIYQPGNKYYQGNIDDYIVNEKYGTSFLYSQYQHHASNGMK